MSIGHFEKYHNTLCLSPQILRKHCFQLLLGIKKAPGENKNSAYAKFGGTNKEYYGIFRSGLYVTWSLCGIWEIHEIALLLGKNFVAFINNNDRI